MIYASKPPVGRVVFYMNVATFGRLVFPNDPDRADLVMWDFGIKLHDEACHSDRDGELRAIKRIKDRAASLDLHGHVLNWCFVNHMRYDPCFSSNMVRLTSRSDTGAVAFKLRYCELIEDDDD